ncbi:MAG: aminotransferase class I/II-fold pyridoxal phosphate-dependent enzyme, partial [Planctomycetota bacterium]
GGTELILAKFRAFLRRGLGLITLGPTFGEPRASAEAVGAPHLDVWPASLEEGFDSESSLQRLALALGSCPFPIGLVYLCSPNNPTGTAVSSRMMERVRALVAPAPLLLDRSFESLRLPGPLCSKEGFQNLHTDVEIVENVLELRSFTKDFGIPGLRLGALFGDGGLVGRCRTQLYPWSVSSGADAAGRALLAAEADEFLMRTRALWHGDARALWSSLSERGVTVLPSTVPFGLVRLGMARVTRRKLMERGVHVRDCASFGLPEHIRLVGRPASELARLLGAIDTLEARSDGS